MSITALRPPAAVYRLAARPGVALALALIVGACAPAAPSPPPAVKQPPPAATPAPAPTTAPAATAKPAEAATPTAQPKASGAASRVRTDLVIAMTQKSVTLDPTIDSAQQSDVKLLFDPLVFLTPDMKIRPALATEWRLVDPTTWELKLRHNVTFHNGDPFTAADVKFNFDRILNPDTQSRQVAPYYPLVKDTQIVDDYTIRILTKQPWPAMLEMISYMRVAPAKYFQEVGAERFAQKPIGSGAYKFVEWVKDSHITYEANEQYWNGAPAIKNLTIRSVPDASTRLAQLLTGEADLIDYVSPSAAATIKATANLDLLTTRSMQTMFVGMNTFRKPFDDVRVRQALNYAINWDEIIDKVLSGYAFRNATSTGALTMGYDPNLKPYPYDPEKAKQLLAEAGYPNGFETTLDGTIDRYNADREVGEAIVGQLARVGVRVKYSGAEFAAFFTRFLSDPALPMADGERALAPKAYTGMYFLGCGNSTGGDFDLCNRLHFHSQVRGIYYNSPKVDAVLDAVSSEMDRDARVKKAEQALRTIQEEAPWIFAYDDVAVFGVKKGLVWTPRPDGYLDVPAMSWSQ